MASTLPTPSDCCSQCDGLTVEITTCATPNAPGEAGIFVCETLAALRAVASSANNRLAILLGQSAKYDFGPAKQYYWDATSTDSDNPLTVVAPNDAGVAGRWIQVL